MATLIPSIGTCRFDTKGERRFAQRLESKLEDDYLCWFNVPVGPSKLHPDFIILNPRRGLIILEVKDWRLDNIKRIDPNDVQLLTDRGVVNVKNPLVQAREYALAVVDILKNDPQLVHAEGRFKGKLLLPWTFGVVLTNITRRAFESTDLGGVIHEHRVICKDEMTESVDALEFQERLWGMFTIYNKGMMTLPQIERVRWHLFPEVRIPCQQMSLFDVADNEPKEIPDILRVMDLQQEQLARSLGGGHRIIHGVAGSGKTLILGYRAQYLAKVCSRPILILCYNRVLSLRLLEWMQAHGLGEKVHVRTFHAWCRDQLVSYNMGLPSASSQGDAFHAEMVDRVIRAVDRQMIPAGQYDAVLIDEGHDFRPEWLKLVVQMINPKTNSLLLLYDDAQSIYDGNKKINFSFKSVGIQAAGRTSILRINYRNTREIHDFATAFAYRLLVQKDADEDSIPMLTPVSAGGHGSKPIVVKLPRLQDEADFIAGKLLESHAQGVQWNNMAVLYRHWEPMGKLLFNAMVAAKVPFCGKQKISFKAQSNKVKLLPFHSSKGLEFAVVIVSGGEVLEKLESVDEQEMKLFYVAMTRATSQLIVTVREPVGGGQS